MTLLTELEEFVRDHRQHGRMTGDATQPASNGYRLTVACAWAWCSSGGSRLKKPMLTYSDLCR
jgi:hypothetical protein